MSHDDVQPEVYRDVDLDTANKKAQPSTAKTLSHSKKVPKDNVFDNDDMPWIQNAPKSEKKPVVTTHSLARDHGVIRENFSTSEIVNESGSKVVLSSAIRWPINRSSSSSKSKDRKDGVPRRVQVVTSADNWTKKIEL